MPYRNGISKKYAYHEKTSIINHSSGTSVVVEAADVSVTGLRTEQMVDPMGLDTAAPRMSWRLESSQRNVMQTAYRILVASSPELLAQDKGDLWDSGKVESDASVWIPYQGKRLKSNQRVYWKVRSYTNRGETEWSEPARWGMGPLGEIHWKGRWIVGTLRLHGIGKIHTAV